MLSLYVLVSDKVTALLLSLDFKRSIDGDIHNSFIGRPRELTVNFIFTEKTRKIDS